MLKTKVAANENVKKSFSTHIFVKICEILRKFELIQVQDHSRSSILVPIESTYTTSFNSNFGRISYRFTSNQDQNDQRPILHILSNIFHQRKCFVFVIFVCNYLGGPHDTAATSATWPYTYLLYSKFLSNI